MNKISDKMKEIRWQIGLIGLLLVLVSLWQLRAASQGLEITKVSSNDPPLTFISPVGAQEPRPLVLVGHGFAGSRQLMRGFAFSLAHAGYSVALWDFEGHGANPNPLPQNREEGNPLLVNAEAALVEAAARGLAHPGRVAILGHSMGSGVALDFGQIHPDTAATIAVSPVHREVSPTLPRNLLLMAGSLEVSFVRTAERLLAQGGGPNQDHASGMARALTVIPGVEHISILFAPAAHWAAVEWLNRTFGPQPGAKEYTDLRMLWWGVGLLGVLAIASALSPLVAESQPDLEVVRPLWHRVGALCGGALGATLILWGADMIGAGLSGLFGILVGGYMFLWFGVVGVLSLLLLRLQLKKPSKRAFLGGLISFAGLWLGAGLLGHMTWLPWLLIVPRLLIWPLGVLLLLPWFLAVGEAMWSTGQQNFAGQLGWWLGHSIILVIGFLLAASLSSGLGILFLIAPAFPLILGIHALAIGTQRGNWPYALSAALWISWSLLAVFPLQ